MAVDQRGAFAGDDWRGGYCAKHTTVWYVCTFWRFTVHTGSTTYRACMVKMPYMFGRAVFSRVESKMYVGECPADTVCVLPSVPQYHVRSREQRLQTVGTISVLYTHGVLYRVISAVQYTVLRSTPHTAGRLLVLYSACTVDGE